MKINLYLIILFFVLNPYNAISQNYTQQIKEIETQISRLNRQKDSLYNILEQYKLKKIHSEILKYCLPELDSSDELIEHKAMCLVYSEPHEQAKWVAHIISKDIKNGGIGRTNDFRPDTMIKTGSAIEADYFLRIIQPDSTTKYEGFGFDRGHLAPSADFRWSKTALSESYLYSNMSPQRPQFNRGSWAELEDMLRAYVIDKNVDLFVVTGPVLTDTMKYIKRSVNKVSIPDYFFKVAYDTVNKKGIGFLMPNKKIKYPLEHYAKSIDKIEEITGINFFANIDSTTEESIESQTDVRWWLPNSQKDDVEPLTKQQLPKNCYNTVQAEEFVNTGYTVRICGTVVSTYKSRKGNIFINLDKKYPNQIFTISIFAKDVINFSYSPDEYLKGKVICVKGKISDYRGVPSMIINDQKDIQILK